MKKRIWLFVLFVLLGFQQVFCQEKASEGRFYTDFVMGPYIFIEHIPYESVFLKGARLGYEHRSKLGVTLEYLAGHQEDVVQDLGTTHHVSLLFSYFLLPDDTKFRPYISAGGGFLEFKDFNRDKFGAGYLGILGTETNIQPWLKGLIEFRYINIADFDYEANKEIGVIWGLRMNF